MGKIRMVLEVKQMTLKEVLKDFQRYNVIKGLAVRTIEYYEVNCTEFIDYLENISVKDLTKTHIRDYIYMLTQKDIHTTTINTRLRSVRTFINYLTNEGYIPKFEIKLLKEVKEIKETYTDDELKMLLKKPNIKKCDFSEYRNWVTVNYLFSTGNRLNTVINLQIQDLDINNGVIKLTTTKNKIQQIIPLSSAMLKILIEYLRFRKGEPENYLFCTTSGYKLTEEGLRSNITRYNNRRGVTKTSIHLFRHTFAKKFIHAGGDAFRLQRLLGHSDLTMTRNYVNMFNDDLKIDYNKYNPLENFLNSNNELQIPNRIQM